jgi:diguanylate cyclase (GGDEF)-like protein
VREGAPVIHNDYASLPHRKGLPEGHAPVIREMVFPILRDQKMIAIIGVGNKAQNYTENDIAYASRLADMIWDITARKRAENAEREQRTMAEALSSTAAALNSTLNFDEVLDRVMDNVGRVVQHDSVGILLLDETGQTAQVAGYRVTGDQPAAMKEFRFTVQETRNLREMQGTGASIIIADTGLYDGWIVAPSGAWIRSTLGVPIKVKGEIIGFLCLDSALPNTFTPQDAERLQAFVDYAAIAIENARLYEEVQKLAVTDTLTNIFNRTFFETELARLELSRDFPVSVVVADLDNMKKTNDTLGHVTGDELLKCTAQILQTVFRASDILARIGGDEFAILLPHTDATTMEQMLSRIQAKLAEHNVRHPALPVQLSLGSHTAEHGNLTEAFILADRRMYADKARRKSS